MANQKETGAGGYVSGRTSYRPKHPKCKDCGKHHSTMLLCYPVKKKSSSDSAGEKR